MTNVSFGIIGCGMMGQEHLRNIALVPGARVAAIYEPDQSMRNIAQSMVPHASFANSVSEVVRNAEVTCLLIASPNFLHLAQLQEIAAIRALPILCEKPLFTDPADAPALAALRDQYPAPIWVAMEYRYMPPVAHLIREAETATGGIKMLTIREHRFPFLEKVGDWNRFNKNSGGTFVEKCCHFFDLMRLIAGCNPVRIMASAGQSVNHLDESYGGEVPDIWDNGYVIVDFESGLRAMLELCMFAEGARYQEEISAVGPLGKIECLVPGPGRFWPAHLGEPPVPQVIVSPRNPKGPQVLVVPVDPTILAAGDHNGSTYYQHMGFSQVVKGAAQPDVTLLDGWWAVAMGMAAQQSATTGMAVDLTKVDYAPKT